MEPKIHRSVIRLISSATSKRNLLKLSPRGFSNWPKKPYLKCISNIQNCNIKQSKHLYQNQLFNNLNKPLFLTLIKLINEKQYQFNKIINLSGNEPPLGFWKFRENQYFTINHPVTTSQEKWAFKVDKIFSPKICK